MKFTVTITRIESIAFEIDAEDADDAQERYLMDGDEVDSRTIALTIDNVQEGAL